jgi:hypothetical protein
MGIFQKKSLLDIAAGSDPVDRALVVARATETEGKALLERIEAYKALLTDYGDGYMLQPKDFGLIAAGDPDQLNEEAAAMLAGKGINLDIIRNNGDEGKALRRAAMRIFTEKADVIELQNWLDAGYESGIKNNDERADFAELMSKTLIGEMLGGTFFRASFANSEINSVRDTQKKTIDRVYNWDASNKEFRDEKLVANTIAVLKTTIKEAATSELVKGAKGALGVIERIATEIQDSNSASMPALPDTVLNILYRAGIRGLKNQKAPANAPDIPDQTDPRMLRDGKDWHRNNPMFIRNRRWRKSIAKTAVSMVSN